jgi:histidine triad (HIT) family protein
MADGCLFCKIVAGEIPSTKVYEDDRVFAFMDINPINTGHLLVIPKKHAATIYEIDPEDLTAVMLAVQKLAQAQRAAIGMEGMNVLQSNGRAANQIIDHLHVHLIPRWPEDSFSAIDWKLIPGDMEEIAATAEKIAAKLIPTVA